MTLYLSFRSHNVGGFAVDPVVLRGDGTADPLLLQTVSDTELAGLVAGKNVVFAVHGFNVSRQHGAFSLGQLEPQFGLGAGDLFFAVLWPGDSWLPFVDYPFEGGIAIDCGKRLAAFCARSLARAQSLSFFSHSLGARLVLEAVKNLPPRKARLVCLTAAAINHDCLSTQYAAAASNATAIAILASHNDHVLKLAFPIGDPIAVLLNDDHTLFQSALGYGGPPVPASPPVAAPWQIAEQPPYDHGDYLPPSNIVQQGADLLNANWLRVAQFMNRAFRSEHQTWPV